MGTWQKDTRDQEGKQGSNVCLCVCAVRRCFPSPRTTQACVQDVKEQIFLFFGLFSCQRSATQKKHVSATRRRMASSNASLLSERTRNDPEVSLISFALHAILHGLQKQATPELAGFGIIFLVSSSIPVIFFLRSETQQAVAAFHLCH